MQVSFAREPALSPAEFVDLLRRSTLAARRPVDDPQTISAMLANASILLTARADELSVQQALNAGANGYLLKPFAPAALEDKLRDMFAIQLNSETESLPSISDGEHP